MNPIIRRVALAIAIAVPSIIVTNAFVVSPRSEAVAAGSTTEITVVGVNGVPADASAVVLNVTAADAGSSGYVTVWPCGEARPNASNLNYRPGGAVANSTIVRVGAGGKVCMFTETATQLIVDINGWFPASSNFVSGTPARVLDTRSGGATVDGVGAGGGLRGAGSTTELVVAGRGGVAANASTVVLNVTAADAGSSGYVTVWPCGEARPNASNLNYRPGGAVANSTIVRVGAGGKVCMFTETATQLIVDINGWFPASSNFVSGTPARVLDTRSGGATVDGVGAGGGLRGAGSTTELVVAGRGGVAANASAVVLNVTAADAGSSGYVTVWPCGEARPNASSLNYQPGGAVANSTIVRVGAGGKVCMFTETATQLIVDINGWFPAAAEYQPMTPARIIDTRLTTAGPTTSAPTTPAPTAGPTPSGTFVETFDGNTGFDRFDYGIYHRDEVLVGNTTWTGDHDLSCGSPDTQRLIHRSVLAESFYLCKDHLMTSIGDTAGYSTGWFAPKESFHGDRTVSWDVNVTDLKHRQWWEVSIVSSSYYSGIPTCPQCSATVPASNLPVPPNDAVIFAIGPNSDLFLVSKGVNRSIGRSMCESGSPLDPEGCASKAIRRTFTMTDNGNGTVSVRFLGNVWTYPGSFPADYKVVFKDHNYTPDKDGAPVGHTWHWDNIIVS